MALREVLAQTSHRPFPLPHGPWVMSQWWRKLLFAHWALPAESVQRLLPAGLRVHTFEGNAYVAVVPFSMESVRPRAIPLGVDFLELNVRTYVEPDGVYFWSLEASSPLAVWGARALFHLPYMHAKMSLYSKDGWVEYESKRIHRGESEALFRGRYRPRPEPYQACALARWFTERYCLYTTNAAGDVYRGDIHHIQWPLQLAEAEFEVNTMAAACGVDLPSSPPILHYVPEIEVVIWPLRKHRSA